MEVLYFASHRTNASVENIQALGFAAAQMGSSAGAAQTSLENLARFMRNSPGAEGLLRGIGVQTRDMNGGLRDTTAIIGDLGRQFARMPYYRANAYAQALGIDERTLMAMREGMGGFSDEYREMLRAAGLDSQEAAKQSHLFMNQLRTLGSAFVILGQKIATSLAGSLSGDLRRFREGVVGNFQRITDIVGSVIKGILFLADAISTLSFRAMQVIGGVVDWFNSLDDGTKKVIIGIGLLTAAWKLLNSAFAASPIGRIVMLGTALLALYDDYKVWKEGGKSLIDWSRWLPDIELAQRVLKRMGEQFTELGEIISAVSERRWGDLAKHSKEFAKLAVNSWKDIYSTIRAQVAGAAPKLNTPIGPQSAKPYSLFSRPSQATSEASAPTEPSEPSGDRSSPTVPSAPSVPSARLESPASSTPTAPSASPSANAAAAATPPAQPVGTSLGIRWGDIANSAFGALISKGEGSYDSVNRGASGGYQAGTEKLESMTIAQVMAAQRAHQFNAAGRYQIIGSTLADAVKSLGLTGGEKFDKATQDRIFEQYLLQNKRKAIGDYISGKSSDLVAAIKAASLEWASVADPDTGRSHYAGVGNNKATISPAEITRALENARITAAGNPYRAEQLAAASTSGAADVSDRQVVIHQQNSTVVHGATDPRATGQAVANAQDGVNQRLIRNMRSVAT
jgi:hypothetical protein